MPLILKYVKNLEDIKASISVFNRDIHSNRDLAKELFSGTHYWVYDSSIESFGASKFVAFTNMNFKVYREAKDEQIKKQQGKKHDLKGDRFNGTKTREAIEKVLNSSYTKDDKMASDLIRWGEAKLGSGIFDGIKTDKWKFIALRNSAPKTSQKTISSNAAQNPFFTAPIAESSEAHHLTQNRYVPISYPDEITGQEYAEGAVKTITVNAYERDPKAREACIKHFGCACYVCGFDFSKIYGERGEGFIHVHHIKELSTIREQYSVDPIDDLRPLCPNCHAMIHREKPAMDPDKLKAELSTWRAYNSEFNKSS